MIGGRRRLGIMRVSGFCDELGSHAPRPFIGAKLPRLSMRGQSRFDQCCRKSISWLVDQLFPRRWLSDARRGEGPHRPTRKRLQAFVHVLPRLAAAGAVENKFLAIFRTAQFSTFSTASTQHGRGGQSSCNAQHVRYLTPFVAHYAGFDGGASSRRCETVLQHDFGPA
jgi:hypothetical protein